MSAVNNPTTGFPQRYQPSYVSIYPDRPVYRAANTYEKIYPWTNALTSALYTNGSAATKIKAGSDDFIASLAMQQALRLYRKGVRRFYERHPRYAEFANRHPILAGIPTTIVGLGLAFGSYFGATKLWQAIRHRLLDQIIDRGAEKAAATAAGKGFARLWKPFERFMRHPVVMLGLTAGLIGFAALLIIRRLQDSWHFGREYRQARQEQPAPSPYDLRHQVALKRNLDFEQGRWRRDPERIAALEQALSPVGSPYNKPQQTPTHDSARRHGLSLYG